MKTTRVVIEYVLFFLCIILSVVLDFLGFSAGSLQFIGFAILLFLDIIRYEVIYEVNKNRRG